MSGGHASVWAVTAVSHYLHTVLEGEALPALDERLAAVCRERFRRVDRFTQLALLGSAECAAQAKLADDCALYLSSGIGPVGSNVEVQEQLCRARQIPKPFHFVNTLGSASGYYVARNLGLAGQNLFLSRRGSSFQAALLTAVADLSLGVTSQALVGAVEECTPPLAHHRQRQGLEADAPVAEGSHWILLESAPVSDRQPRLSVDRFSLWSDLVGRVRSDWVAGDHVSFAHGVDVSARAQLLRALDALELHDPAPAGHDSCDAAVLTRCFMDQSPRRLCFVSGGERQGWLHLHVGA